MINAIKVIALNTYKESIRDRILITLGVFAVLLLGATLFLGSISLDQDSKIIIELGLTGIFFFGIIITIFLSGSSIAKELDQRTAYTVLARPITRLTYLLGKFAGLCLTVLMLIGMMSVIFGALLVIRLGWQVIDVTLILALFYTYLEMVLLIALTVMFSSFCSAVISTVYALAIFIIGHSSATVVNLSQDSPVWIKDLYKAVYYIFPNLEKFNLRNNVVYHIQPTAEQISLVIVYTVVYSAILLFLANAAFRKQEL
ncbi:MAG: ABC transporter permease subunit [Patescibacteria group bacterium]|jgi:ABC-type transport system involved in multi-copper enzyme maturation permease subunit